MDLNTVMTHTKTPVVMNGENTPRKKYMIELRVSGMTFTSMWMCSTDEKIEALKNRIAASMKDAVVIVK